MALLLMLTMVLTVVPCVASATEGDPNPLIDTERKGSITVTKYATIATLSGTTPTHKGNATGTQSDALGAGDTDYTPLKGATFKLFKIADADAVMAYYNGTSTTTYSLEQFDYQDDGTASYNSMAISDTNILTGETTGNGTFKFDNLPVGIYVLKEVTAPAQITTPLAEDSLISIPMVNTATSNNNDNAEWMYDVYVYPKNHESTGTIELTKQDQNGTALKDVVFNLYKKEFQSGGSLSADWAEVTGTTNNNGTSTTLTLTTDATGMITLANLPSGLYGTQYKLDEVSAPDGYIVNRTPLYFKVNNDNTITWNETSGDTNGCNNTNTGVTATMITTEPKLSITLRNELPSLTKQVKENGGDAWKMDEQYRLDDEITYRLTVYVPNNVAELGTFEIKDVPQVGITDSTTNADYQVICDGNSLTTENYTLNFGSIPAGASNGQGFILTFTDTGKAAVKGKTIQIVYKAHMNANAVIAGNGNGNTPTLTYSKYIGVTDTTTYAITDEARVYTYQYQITKRKDSTTGDVAGGVEFNLLYSEAGTPVEVYKETDGVYRLWLTSDTDTTKKTTTLATIADGTILIKGLENGTYYLKETKTIDGYNLLSAPFAIQVNVTETTTWDPGDWATNATQFTATGRTVKTYLSTSYNVTDAKGTSTIINKKGFVLPQTGGMGYLLFCAVGIALIGGGAALIFGGRKKKIR